MLFPLPGMPFPSFLWSKRLHIPQGEALSLLEGPQPGPSSPPTTFLCGFPPRYPAAQQAWLKQTAQPPDVSPGTEPPDGPSPFTPAKSAPLTSPGPTGPFLSVASRLQAHMASSMSWETKVATPQPAGGVTKSAGVGTSISAGEREAVKKLLGVLQPQP